MHLYRGENVNLSKVQHDQVRDFCLCEKVDEVYMRHLLRRDFYSSRDIMKMKNARAGWKKVLIYGAVVLLLFILQEVLGKAGSGIADIFPYGKIDPYNAYAWICVHHIAEMLLALVAVLILSKLFKIDFGFGLGDMKKGAKFIALYVTVFTGITLIVHILMMLNNSLPVYDYPLTRINIIGTLGFQLLLSGPAEELVYRALPITIMVFASGRSVEVRWGITLENIIAAFLFALAHMSWSLIPFTMEADCFQLFYAFAQGIISGKAYQDTRSIIYPMFMHSFSNVLMVGMGYLFLLL